MSTSRASSSILKRIAVSAAAISAAVASSVVFSNSASAQSVSGKTQINFEVQPFVRLYYKDSVDITLKPNPESSANGQKSSSISASYDPDSGVSGGGDVGVTTSAQNAKGTIGLENFWAVQSIAYKRTAVTVYAKEQKANGPNGSTIYMPGFEKREEFEPTGLANTQYGSVELDIDMANARYAGTYKGGVIVVQADNY